jgi:hypothetical protein
MVSTSIWIKPSGVEVSVDEASASAAEDLGWKRKESVQAEEPKRKGRPKGEAK